MKKLLFVLGAVVLLAAGCSGSESMQTAPSTDQTSSTQQSSQGSNTAGQQMAGKTQVQSNVKVSNVDDAVNVIEKNSTSEQTAVSSGDDSDLTASDSSELNSFTEVPNEN